MVLILTCKARPRRTVDARMRSQLTYCSCSGDILADGVHPLLNNYEEFKLDSKTAPHTIGTAHMYIRKDIVTAAEAHGIVPPYPVNFPPNHPHDHKNWYLDKLRIAN